MQKSLSVPSVANFIKFRLKSTFLAGEKIIINNIHITNKLIQMYTPKILKDIVLSEEISVISTPKITEINDAINVAVLR